MTLSFKRYALICVAVVVAVSMVSAVISGSEGELQAPKIIGVWYWEFAFIVIAALTSMSSVFFFRSGSIYQVRACAKAATGK